jgi:hypothetical protein
MIDRMSASMAVPSELGVLIGRRANGSRCGRSRPGRSSLRVPRQAAVAREGS